LKFVLSFKQVFLTRLQDSKINTNDTFPLFVKEWNTICKNNVDNNDDIEFINCGNDFKSCLFTIQQNGEQYRIYAHIHVNPPIS
jgi:hypothetical protein